MLIEEYERCWWRLLFSFTPLNALHLAWLHFDRTFQCVEFHKIFSSFLFTPFRSTSILLDYFFYYFLFYRTYFFLLFTLFPTKLLKHSMCFWHIEHSLKWSLCWCVRACLCSEYNKMNLTVFIFFSRFVANLPDITESTNNNKMKWRKKKKIYIYYHTNMYSDF